MGWFDKQLKKRKQNDDEQFSNALLGIAGAVLNKKIISAFSNEEITNLAINKIFQYFRIKINENIELPKKFNNLDDEINFICRPYGIWHREITLEDKWYKYAFGPMLGTLKENNEPVAIIPSRISGRYSIYNLKTGKKTKLNRFTVKTLSNEAVYFYCPLPLRKLKVVDLLKYMVSQITVADVVLFFLMTAVTSVVALLSPLFTKWLFGYVIEQKDYILLVGLSTFMITFSLTQLLIACFKTLIDSRIGTKIELTMSNATMQRLLSLPSSFFKNYGSGELIVHVRQLTTFCSQIISSVIVPIVTALFSFISIGQIWMFAPSLVIPSLIVTIINIVFSFSVAYVRSRIFKKQLKTSAKENGMSYAMITGIQKIKLAGAEKRMFSRWSDLYIKNVKLEFNPPLYIKLASSISFLITSVGTIIMYGIAINHKIPISDYYAFTSAFATVSSAFTALASVTTSIGTIRPTYKMAKPLLDAVPESSETKLCLNNLRGNLELNNVSFRYSDDMPLVINNLSLKINPGDYIAIVGKTGCGKSTLIRLLLGFEKPQKGAIYYDKHDLNNIDLQSLRQNIGTVMQNCKLFNSDIYSNITISAPWVKEEDAWRAAKIASIDEDIKKMPMGMHTFISEGQGGISGGQRQRLAIARAVVSNPRILIFDEATSALDNVTQKKVSDAIDSLKCTRIVVAHRLTTIKNCHRIIVLDKGQVVEEGTYDDLIKKNGFFAELVKRQRIDVDAE